MGLEVGSTQGQKVGSSHPKALPVQQEGILGQGGEGD